MLDYQDVFPLCFSLFRHHFKGLKDNIRLSSLLFFLGIFFSAVTKGDQNFLFDKMLLNICQHNFIVVLISKPTGTHLVSITNEIPERSLHSLLEK